MLLGWSGSPDARLRKVGIGLIGAVSRCTWQHQVGVGDVQAAQEAWFRVVCRGLVQLRWNQRGAGLPAQGCSLAALPALLAHDADYHPPTHPSCQAFKALKGLTMSAALTALGPDATPSPLLAGMRYSITDPARPPAPSTAAAAAEASVAAALVDLSGASAEPGAAAAAGAALAARGMQVAWPGEFSCTATDRERPQVGLVVLVAMEKAPPPAAVAIAAAAMAAFSAGVQAPSIHFITPPFFSRCVLLAAGGAVRCGGGGQRRRRRRGCCQLSGCWAACGCSGEGWVCACPRHDTAGNLGCMSCWGLGWGLSCCP